MLRLRPFKLCDAKYMVEWIKDERVFSMWSAGHFTYPLTIEQLTQYKESYDQEESGWIFTAIDEKGKPIGHFLMKRADYEEESIHLGFIVVDPELRGRGYGVEMVRLGLKYAFEILQVKRVTLGVFDVNPTAKCCYKKVGFQTETYHKDVFPYKEELWGIYSMAAHSERLA